MRGKLITAMIGGRGREFIMEKMRNMKKICCYINRRMIIEVICTIL